MSNFIKNILIKIVAGKIKDKIEEADKMNDSKKWYQSKVVLSGIATVLVNAYQFLQWALPLLGVAIVLPPIPEFVFVMLNSIFGGIAVYGRTTATKTIG